MKSKDGRTLWRVEVHRVLYVLADSPEMAKNMAKDQMGKHNDAEVRTLLVKKGTTQEALKDGWYHSLPYGGTAEDGSVRLIGTSKTQGRQSTK